jgi:hypothetical protein
MRPFTLASPVYDPVAAWGIGGIAVVMALVVLAVVARWQPAFRTRAAVLTTGWMAATAAWALSGGLAQFDRRPPPMALLIVLVFASAFAIGLGPFGGRLARTLPLVVLVGLQAFRLPLELVMHRAATRGIMLPELSYSGYNYDIVTGAGAAAIAALMIVGVRVPRAVVWAWNVWGLWRRPAPRQHLGAVLPVRVAAGGAGHDRARRSPRLDARAAADTRPRLTIAPRRSYTRPVR